MSDRNVRVLLFLTVLIVSALPLIASLYFLDRSLQTSLNLGFNRQIADALEVSSRNLLALKTLDPQRQAQYREEFEASEELRHVYANPDLLRRSIRDSLRVYFALGLLASVGFSVLVAALLSRRIARAYSQTFAELLAQRDKVRYLQEISSWQELAKMLAHEIKNPLTPIEVLVSSLRKAHEQLSNEEFSARLAQTQTMIGEELQHLKHTVDKFADFARLPTVQLARADLAEVLAAHLHAVGPMFPSARIAFAPGETGSLPARVDTTAFRQVLVNILRNAVEANPGRDVLCEVRASSNGEVIEIALLNDGAAVPDDLVSRLFDPYISGKSGPDNMGLGLAIVRKIVIDHGGDIRYECRQGHPAFVISLPQSAS